MFCPKCGTEIPEGTQTCRNCNCTLIGTTQVIVSNAKTSGLAIASMILGLLSIIASFLTGLPAIVLGIISLIQISRSKGQLKGTGMAITGIAASCVFIALSMAILLPALSRARDMGKRAVCLNNLRQLGLATMMYREANDEKFPTPDKWCDLIEKYHKNNRLLVCPSAGQEKCSYSINENLPKNSDQIRRPPQEMILLFESNTGWNQAGGPELLTTKNHRGCNIVFCDGHVEFVKFENIGKLKWTAGP